MLEKLRLYRDDSITLANFPDKVGEAYRWRGQTLLDQPLQYQTLSGPEISARQGLEFACRVSRVLTEKIGVRRGDAVGVYTNNNVDLLLILMGVFRSGAIAVPLNYMLRRREIRYILEDCGARTLVTDPDLYRMNLGSREALPTIANWVMAGPAGDVPPGLGFHVLDALMAEAPAFCEPASLRPEEPVAIFYTSGTTGFPKGAVMCSRGLLAPQKRAVLLLPAGPKDFGVFALPLAHIMGFCTVILGLLAGVSGYFIPHFDAEKVMAALQKFRATAFAGVPTMYAMMIHSGIEKYDLSSVKLWASAADAMPEEYVKVLRKVGAFARLGPLRLPAVIVEVYGMVELSGSCCMKIAFPGLRYPPRCVGFPVAPTRVRIVDETGSEMARGKEGELAVKGPGVTLGYWNKEEETRACFTPDGWFRTGDMARKDRLGRIHFVDRKKDVIKSGGYSVFSREVEAELLTNPKIAEAAVIGVPHPTKKEVPVAIVTLAPGAQATEAELLEWARQNLARYRAPRDVKIIPASEMPYGMTLKILKRKLRDRYLDEYTKKFEEKRTL